MHGVLFEGAGLRVQERSLVCYKAAGSLQRSRRHSAAMRDAAARPRPGPGPALCLARSHWLLLTAAAGALRSWQRLRTKRGRVKWWAAEKSWTCWA